MEKYQGKYRISSIRLKNWDYSSQGMYFITICTKCREHYFGEIFESEDGHNEMNLSELGKIVELEWIKTPEIRPDMNLELDEFVVMPNHFHSILIIGANEYNSDIAKKMLDANVPSEDCVHHVSSAHPESEANLEINLGTEPEIDYGTTSDNWNKFAPQSKNLGSVMRGFKSAVTTFANTNNIPFNWQPRFYEHIIRDNNEYLRIKKYIKNNPANWISDRLRLPPSP
jgi:REP element-mobilizing transposase RayT